MKRLKQMQKSFCGRISHLWTLINCERGQTLAEYGLLLVLVVVVVFLMVKGFGHGTNSTYSTINSALGQ